jgi:hypothetical protein
MSSGTRRWAGSLALMVGGALFAQDIHFKTRNFQPDPPPGTDSGLNTAVLHPPALDPGEAAAPVGSTNTTAIHKIILFDHQPGVEDLDALLRDGINALAALPDNALVVNAPGGLVPPRAGVRWVGSLPAADKISPQLVPGAFTEAGTVSALVEFHSDVTTGQQDTVAGAEGVALQRTAAMRGWHALMTASAAQLAALAEHDEVAYLFPADAALMDDTAVIACAGMLTMTGAIGQYANIVHGWNLDTDHAAHLGYAFGSITPKVPVALVQSELLRALTEWSKYANVTFQPSLASSPRTVVMKFVSGAHGDPYPFDGPGGILGHTFYPVPINSEPIAGDMHLDADENWHAGGDIDIYSVALHEAGHAIGLGHSDKPGDVMYPYYRSRSTLSVNDIGAARTLYGAPNGGSVVPVTSGGPPGGSTPPPTPATLRLVADSPPPTTQATSVAVTGTVSGGTPPWTVQWQTDRGYGGKSTIQNPGAAGASWNTGAVSLVNGRNTITLTAFDAAQKSASQTVAVELQSSPTTSVGIVPLTIRIASPTSSVTTVNAATLNVAGSASGGTGVTRVTWQTAAGASGAATGTDKWLAQGIPLLIGTNTVVVKAWDARGNSAWTTVVAVRH